MLGILLHFLNKSDIWSYRRHTAYCLSEYRSNRYHTHTQNYSIYGIWLGRTSHSSRHSDRLGSGRGMADRMAIQNHNIRPDRHTENSGADCYFWTESGCNQYRLWHWCTWYRKHGMTDTSDWLHRQNSLPDSGINQLCHYIIWTWQCCTMCIVCCGDISDSCDDMRDTAGWSHHHNSHLSNDRSTLMVICV